MTVFALNSATVNERPVWISLERSQTIFRWRSWAFPRRCRGCLAWREHWLGEWSKLLTQSVPWWWSRDYAGFKWYINTITLCFYSKYLLFGGFLSGFSHWDLTLPVTFVDALCYGICCRKRTKYFQAMQVTSVKEDSASCPIVECGNEEERRGQ